VRRADRLFQIIQLLRSRRRAVTARWLAEQLEVSERTVYRDIRDLVSNGTPIEGEAGVGYTLRSGYDLPPLMFDAEEIEALVLGARVVAAFGDEKLAKAAGSVLSKVENVLPKRLRPKLGEAALFAPRTGVGQATSDTLLALRAAMAERRKLLIHYVREDGEATERVIRPLGAFFWGRTWTVTAWCELRRDFRNFRLDRVGEVRETGEAFADEPGRTLRDYLRTIGPEAEEILER
jgi:predicted DNA-binding transcriptional regulator YafY